MTRVAVYGATGKLGGAVISRLMASGADVTLVGRDSARLAATVAKHRGSRVFTASADDEGSLRRAFDGVTVVANAAPAGAGGLRLANAAVSAGAHYVDAAGEQGHIASVFDELTAAATKANVVVVPACGFDYALGDCLVRLAARDLEQATDVVVGYAIEGADVASNSASNAASAPARPEVVYRGARWRPVPFEIDRGEFEFPQPFGRRAMSRYGAGEVITVPRHTKVDNVRALITRTSLCPHPALLSVFPVLRPMLTLARQLPITRSMLGLVARAASRPAPPAMASTEAVVAGERRFAIGVEVRGREGIVARAHATGGDYHQVTAAVLATGALWLTRTVARGVQSPAMAFDPAALLGSLATEGVTWSVSGRA